MPFAVPASRWRFLLQVLLLLAATTAGAATLNYTKSLAPAYPVGLPVPTNNAQFSGLYPSSAVIADFDNDGLPDLVVITRQGVCPASDCATPYNQPTVLFYKGTVLGGLGLTGAFNQMDPGPPATSIRDAAVVAAADLNHDGKLDLVIITDEAFDGHVWVAYGDGHGNFSQPAAVLGTPGSNYGNHTLALKDVNHDGWVDIVVVDNYGTPFSSGNDVLVYLNDGTGHFPAYDQYGTSNKAEGLSVLAEFGGDGNLDMVMLDAFSTGGKQGLSFLKGRSDGTFADPVTKIDSTQLPPSLVGSSGFTGRAVTAAAHDIDGDGCNDFVIGDTDGNVWWSRGHCNDTFSPVVKIANGTTPYDGSSEYFKLGKILFADFNHDGRKDIAYGGVVHLQQADKTFVADLPAVCPPSGTFRCAFLAMKDLNGDGTPDFVTNDADPNKIAFYHSKSGAATTLQLTTGDNQSTVVNTLFPAALKARVVDSGGFPVSGVEVSYMPPSGLAATAAIPGGHGFTDLQGYFSAPATANNTVGCYTVEVQLGVAGVANGTFDLCNTAPNSLQIVSGTPQSAQINVLFAQPLVVHVKDGNGTAVPGIIVSFTAPAAGAGAAVATSVGGLAANAKAANAVSDNNGDALVFVRANGSTGSYNVSVSAPFFASSPGGFKLTNTPAAGAAAKIVVTPAAEVALLHAQYVAPIVAQIADAVGTAVSGTGASLTFAQPNDPASGAGVLLSVANTPCTSGVPGPLTVPASFQGQATVYACASAYPGKFKVTVGVQTNANIAAASAALTNLPTPPRSMAAAGGTPQSTPVLMVFTQTLRVRLLDSNNQPAAFSPVYFAAPAGGPSAMLSSPVAISDQNGYASVTATANGTPGTYPVTAHVLGDVVNPNLVFQLTNTLPEVQARAVPTLSWPLLAMLGLLLPGMAARRPGSRRR